MGPGGAQNELGQEQDLVALSLKVPSECKPFFAIVTHHQYRHSEPEAGTGAVQPFINLMSLVFLDESSSDMSHLLQLSVARAALVVESTQCEAAEDRSPKAAADGKLEEESDKESTNPLPYRLCVVELEEEVWKAWRRRNLKESKSNSSMLVEFVIKSDHVAVGLQNPESTSSTLRKNPHRFKSSTFDAIIRHLLSLRKDPEVLPQYYQEEQRPSLREPLQKWLRTRRLPRQDWGVRAHGGEPTLQHLAGGIFLFFREVRKLGPGAGSSGPASPRNRETHCVIWPSLCLHLGFANQRTGVRDVNTDSFWLTSIKASLLASFQVEAPGSGTVSADRDSRNSASSSSTSRLCHNMLTLSGACSNNPWAVAVQEQRALGFSEVGKGFRERRRGVDTEVKFVAESANPQEIPEAANLEVSATWVVLPHGHHPRMPQTLVFNFTISQKLYPPDSIAAAPADKLNVRTSTDHSWTTTLSISTRSCTGPGFMVECNTTPALLRWPGRWWHAHKIFNRLWVQAAGTRPHVLTDQLSNGRHPSPVAPTLVDKFMEAEYSVMGFILGLSGGGREKWLL